MKLLHRSQCEQKKNTTEQSTKPEMSWMDRRDQASLTEVILRVESRSLRRSRHLVWP